MASEGLKNDDLCELVKGSHSVVHRKTEKAEEVKNMKEAEGGSVTGNDFRKKTKRTVSQQKIQDTMNLNGNLSGEEEGRRKLREDLYVARMSKGTVMPEQVSSTVIPCGKGSGDEEDRERSRERDIRKINAGA